MSGEFGYMIISIVGYLSDILLALDSAYVGGYSYLDICIYLMVFELTLNFVLDVILKVYHAEEEARGGSI